MDASGNQESDLGDPNLRRSNSWRNLKLAGQRAGLSKSFCYIGKWGRPDNIPIRPHPWNIYMTVDRTPHQKKYSVSSPKRIGPFWGTKKLCFSKHRIREGPWRLREGLREGKPWLCKNTGIVKVREGSVKEAVKGIMRFVNSLRFLAPDRNSMKFI